MTENERLTEIIENINIWDKIETSIIVEYLLDNNIIVPPCRVGDIIYKVRKDFTLCSQGEKPNDYGCQGCDVPCNSETIYFIDSGKIKYIQKSADDITVVADWEYCLDNKNYIVGEEVFLTKEEAEKSLKESEKNE